MAWERIERNAPITTTRTKGILLVRVVPHTLLLICRTNDRIAPVPTLGRCNANLLLIPRGSAMFKNLGVCDARHCFWANALYKGRPGFRTFASTSDVPNASNCMASRRWRLRWALGGSRRPIRALTERRGRECRADAGGVAFRWQ